MPSFRWQLVLAIVIVPFVLLSFFAPLVTGASAEVPAWHPHHQIPSTAPRRAATRHVEPTESAAFEDSHEEEEADEANPAEAEESEAAEEADTASHSSSSAVSVDHLLTMCEGKVALTPGGCQLGYVDHYRLSSFECVLTCIRRTWWNVPTLCEGHEDRLPNWLLKQCDPEVAAMVKDFLEHEHLLGTDQEVSVLEQKMEALQQTRWRDGTPIGGAVQLPLLLPVGSLNKRLVSTLEHMKWKPGFKPLLSYATCTTARRVVDGQRLGVEALPDLRSGGDDENRQVERGEAVQQVDDGIQLAVPQLESYAWWPNPWTWNVISCAQALAISNGQTCGRYSVEMAPTHLRNHLELRAEGRVS
jgi:hypothetical protein